ncbi:MAG TPA: sugar nucleotide-binding protein [Chitinophagales bacterium]|nr:sugar nucleotide-binding protein [Chitinophagales bacterium]
MPRALVTGASGTIGYIFCEQLKQQQWEVFSWNRKLVPIDDYYKMENFIKLIRPDVLFHLAYSPDPDQSWFVNYEWSSELAWLARVLNVKFLFASTNLVFKNTTPGPYTIQSIPDADRGYGFEKRKTEERVLFQNPDSIIARLGWQIGEKAGSNNMIDFFDRRIQSEGIIRTSTEWLPACSFLEDTSVKLIELATFFSPGIYMLDSNEQWNLYEITLALNQKFNFGWIIEPTDDYVFDSRMIDKRVKMVSLKERLSQLGCI